MKKSYTIELKVDLEEKDEARAVGVALGNCAGAAEGLIDGPQVESWNCSTVTTLYWKRPAYRSLQFQ
jgi:hypothetical protein